MGLRQEAHFHIKSGADPAGRFSQRVYLEMPGGNAMENMAGFQKLEPKERLRQIKRVLWVILFLNVLVAVFKYAYGVYSQTVSMQADGIHSLFDGAGNVVGLIGMAMASRPADYDHPYGHAKFETYASAIIGILLMLAAYNVGRSAVTDLMYGTASPRVSGISFIIMAGTLVVNVGVTVWEHHEAIRFGSEILGADARHTMSDVLVTIGVIIGLVFIELGYPVMDPVMSLVVACAILFTAFEVFKQVGATLSDRVRIPAEDVAAVVRAVDEVKDCHRVRTRGVESEVYVDLHILVDGSLTVSCAHRAADRVAVAVKDAFPQVMDIVVHIEPDTPEERLEGVS